MPLNFSGNWSINVIGKPPQALPQRFIVSNAITGNGVYSGIVGNIVNVTGANWQLTIQANESYEENGNWINSSMRIGSSQVIGNQSITVVESEDLIQDNSWNDLVLQLTQAIANVPTNVPIIPTQPPIIPTTPIIPNIPVVPNVPYFPPPVITQPPVQVKPVNLGMGRVFTRIEDGDKLPRQAEKITYGIWLDSNGDPIGNMVTFHTCSMEVSSSYRRTIFQKQCDQCAANPHFSISYGHDGGSGSRDLGGNDYYTPTNAIYGQYRGLCLDNSQRFRIGNKEIHHFYAINVARDRMGDSMDEGNLEINIAQLSGSLFQLGNPNRNAHTGSNVKLSGTNSVLRLIDDSTLDIENDLSSAAFGGYYQTVSASLCHLSTSSGKVFYVVSGTLETGIYNKTNPHVYGLSYPNLGIVLLDADLMDASASFLTVTGSDVAGDNAMKLFTAMSGAALLTDASGDYLGFQSRKVKYEYVEQYFIRVKNQEYNFTNNPTYVTGSTGDIISDFYDNPLVYITQIGLYNDNRELLAVAKPSRPILKSFTEESLFEISIKYE